MEESRRRRNQHFVRENWWDHVLFECGADSSNAGLLAYGQRIERWLARAPDPDSKEAAFARYKLLVIEMILGNQSGACCWSP